MRSFFSISEWMSRGWLSSDPAIHMVKGVCTWYQRTVRTRCHEINCIQRLISAHQDVQVDIGDLDGRHMRVLHR